MHKRKSTELLSAAEALLQCIRQATADNLAALKYSPTQPRVPRGNPDGGQWTDAGGGSGDRVTSEGIHEALRKLPNLLDRVAVVASNRRKIPVKEGRQTYLK